MEIELDPVPYARKDVLRHLLELLRHDESEFNGDDIDEFGLYGYRYLDHYWTEPGRHAFFIRVSGLIAGFALVHTLGERDGLLIFSMAEFFVLRKFRRKGVGGHAARALFDRLPGEWRVPQEAPNVAAQAFWRRVIGQYTQGRFEETQEAGWNGPVQVFRSPIP